MVRLSLSYLLTGASLAFLVSPQLVHARPAASPSPAKALDTFCDKFDRACADTCLNGKTGHVKIAFSCAKIPPKNEIFHFGCRCDGKEKTQSKSSTKTAFSLFIFCHPNPYLDRLSPSRSRSRVGKNIRTSSLEFDCY